MSEATITYGWGGMTESKIVFWPRATDSGSDYFLPRSGFFLLFQGRSRESALDSPFCVSITMGTDHESQTGTTLRVLLRNPADPQAWKAFVERYTPKLLAWCRQWRLQTADAQDVT